MEEGTVLGSHADALSTDGNFQITDAVHAKGSFMYLQLWALGRAADPTVLKEEGDYPYVSASDIPMPGNPINTRPLTVEEIKEYVGLYAQAAKNAVKAGFDGGKALTLIATMGR